MNRKKAFLGLPVLIAGIIACTIAPLPTATSTPLSTPSLRPTQTPAPTQAPTPTPSPPPKPELYGGLLVFTDMDELRLITGSGNEQIADELLASDVDTPVISPDQSYVVFSSFGAGRQRSRLLNLQTKKITDLTGHTAACFAWSPDSTKLSIVFGDRNSLYVFDLSGKSQLIYESPSARYEWGTFSGGVSCGVWLNSEHLLFQRFVGPMPKVITFPGARELKPNTTTLATLGNSIKLVDSPEQWLEVNACQTGDYVLLEASDTLYVSQDFTSFEGFKPQPVNLCSGCSWWDVAGFMPQDCQIYYFVLSGSAEWRLAFTDPQTLRSRLGPLLEPPEPELREDRSWDFNGIWLGDPKDMLAAVLESDTKNGYAKTLVIADLQSGSINRLPAGPFDQIKILAWLPEQP